MLSYQRLDVYRCAVQLVAHSARLSHAVPKGYADLGDQLRRAALSVSLNIAEGAGRTTAKDAARCYAIARGSAMECGAILDAFAAVEAADATAVTEAQSLVVRCVEMLTRLSR